MVTTQEFEDERARLDVEGGYILSTSTSRFNKFVVSALLLLLFGMAVLLGIEGFADVTPPPPAPTTTTTTTVPPADGFQVGSGASAMTFPEKPGLLGTEDLPTWTGPVSFTEGTTVIDGYFIDRRIEMRSGDATLILRNCKITVNDYYAILADVGTIVIEHCLFDGAGITGQQMTPAAIGGTKATVRFNEFRNGQDNLRIGPQALVEWNWFHAGMPVTSHGTQHHDGIEIYDAPRPAGVTGPHTVVRNNYIDIGGAEGATGAINLTAYFGPVDGVRIEGNTFLPGGTYLLYIRNDSTGCENVEVVGNRWFTDAGHVGGGFYGPYSVDPESCVSQWSGNTIQHVDGSALRDLPL